MIPAHTLRISSSSMNRSLAVLAVLLGILVPGALAQDVPDVLHYQASLLEDNQQVEGDVALIARIFEAERGGEALWAEGIREDKVCRETGN